MNIKKLDDFEYVLANPTGNITALVVSKVESAKRQFAVQQILKTELTCEQVGFVEPISSAEIKLEMMGNEFCGNATLCAAAYLAEQNALVGAAECLVHSSGIAAPIPVQISKLESNNLNSSIGSTYVGTLAMPIPEISYISLSSLNFDNFELNKSNFKNPKFSFLGQEFPLVKLDGIYHLLVPADQLSESEAENLIKKVAGNFDIPAFGLIQYYESQGDISIKPLVYVKESDTLVWEHGCASGSIAAGYFKYQAGASATIDVLQPGGTITITVNDDKLLLTGTVKF